MSWLIDDPTVLFVVLGIAALVLASSWWMTQKPAYATGLGVTAGLLVVVWLLSTLIDTDAKRIERSIRAMGAAVEANDIDRIFAHVSAQFSVGGMDRASFREHAQRVLQMHHITGITVWDYEAKEISRENRSATVIFKVKAHGIDEREGVPFYNCRAAFVLDADNQWRMSRFQLFSPTIDPMRGEPLPLPF
jgi:hypothetical protein